MKKQEMMMKVENDILHHEKMNNVVFWSPDRKAADKRKNEARHNFTHTYEYKGHEYKYESYFSESRQHCYYGGHFYLDGEEKNLRIFKKLLKCLEEDRKEDVFKDFMEDLEKNGMYTRLKDEERKFLKDRLEWLWEIGGVYGTYNQRYNILLHVVMFFRFGTGYRPGIGWHEM